MKTSAERNSDDNQTKVLKLVNCIEKQNVNGVHLWIEKNICSQEQLYGIRKSLLDQYDEKIESTPIHKACWTNNIEILKLLLQHNPNVNTLYKPNTTKYTTMHIAAKKQNKKMMKLLIEHGFDCNKFINNIYYEAKHRSVFLELCVNTNVECLDYLMNQCQNKIDVWQRDINGENGLHIAVGEQHVTMVQYLLDKVYKNEEMKQKIFNQTVGINNKHISSLAAERATTQDGLVIFKLLKQNKCPLHPLAITYAASYSSLILDYMLNQQLYPNCIYLTNQLVIDTIGNAFAHVVHKNILIIANYLSNMKDKVSIKEYQKWIINMFSNIMMNGTMDGYFKMFKEMIEIFLKDDEKPQEQHHNHNDWKRLITSKIVDKTLLMKIQKKINDSTNIQDIVDDKWCLLLKTMIDSFEDPLLLNKYDNHDNDESDFKFKDDSLCDENDDYCSRNHLMKAMNHNNDDLSSIRKCNYCMELHGISLLSLECVKCQEYICYECFNSLIKLIQLLKNGELDKFNQKLNQYKTIKQENMIKTVEFSE